MSNLREWMNEKSERVKAELDVFFEVNCDRLTNMCVNPILVNIISKDNDYDTLSERSFDNSLDLMYCFKLYQEIVAEINLNTIFVPSIENFCMWMGWNTQVYKKILQSENEDLKSTMELVEDYIIECQLSAGQTGLLAQNLTKFRAQVAGNHGNNLVSQKEKNEDDRKGKKLLDNNEIEDGLRGMGFKLESK
ncbi:hypothetical protein ACWG0P_13965 [Amedibacillus sp. YH-ame6]